MGVNGICGTVENASGSGRISSISFGASPSTIYVGAAGGGVWKTTDGGTTWNPLTDGENTLAVGALAVVPNADPTQDTVYVGTGEGDNSCDSQYGEGILKSTEGGAPGTWSQLAQSTFDRLSFTKIAIDPENPAILYATTTYGSTDGTAEVCLHPPFGPTVSSSGVYKSGDNGVTWHQLSGSGGLPAGGGPNSSTGAGSDVIVDPARNFTGSFSGTMTDMGGGGCTLGSATLQAAPGAPASFVAEPQPDGSYVLSGEMVITQTPSDFCADYSDDYICTGVVPSLSGTPVTGVGAPYLYCFQNFGYNPNAQFAFLVITGSFSGGDFSNATFSGGVSLRSSAVCVPTPMNPDLCSPGDGPDVMENAPFSMAASPHSVFAAVNGDSNGLYKSTDGGVSWISDAVPELPAGGRRMAMDITPDGHFIYLARVKSTQNSGYQFDGIYLSTNHGGFWSEDNQQPVLPGASNGDCNLEDSPAYDLALAADPANPTSLYLGLKGIYSTNSFDQLKPTFIGANTGPYFHAIKVNPAGIFAASDSGIFKSTDGGMSWSDSLNNGLGITMLQSVAVEPSNRYIFAGAELNGAIYLDSTLVSQQDPLAWFPSEAGYVGPVAIDPVIPATSSAENVFFDEGPNTFARYSRTTYPLNFNNQRNALPGADPYNPIDPSASPDTAQIAPPFTEDPDNPDRILYGTNRIWESCAVNGTLSCNATVIPNGQTSPMPTWNVISEDLTGGCKTGFCNISGIAIAPTNPAVVYAVTSTDGSVPSSAWVSTDATCTGIPCDFSNVSAGLPTTVPLTSVAVSPTDPMTVLVTASGFSGGRKHVFLSTNGGSTWADISTGLPDVPALSVMFDQCTPATSFYVGTDSGVFHTTDAGATWNDQSLEGLPKVPVYQLQQNSSVIVAATHGRGAWTLPACGQSATSTPTSTATPTVTPTSTETPTQTPTEEATETPTETPTESPTEAPSETPTSTSVGSTSLATPTVTGSAKATGTPTAIPTRSATAIGTPTATATATATSTPTATPTPKPAQIFVAPKTLNFPLTGVGATSPTKSFEIKNFSKTNPLFGNIILPAGAFTLSPPPGQFVVPPRQATKVGVSFAPTSSTNYTAQIEIDSNDPNQSQVNVALSGVGQAGILSAPGGVAFGVTRVSRSANRRMTLRNRGKGVLSGTIPFVAGVFSISPPGPFTLRPGQALPASVTFKPIVPGPVDLSVPIEVNAPSQPQPSVTVQFSGTGK